MSVSMLRHCRLLLCCVLLFLSSSILNAQNPIVTENALTGNPASEWDISGAGDLSIQGFATDLSVNRGNTVYFKIKTDAAAYTIDIYRLGYYGGAGARKVASTSAPLNNVTITATLPQIQPADLYDPVTGLTDCGNWAVSAEWAIPSTAVSGIYIAKIKRTDTEGASHIVFIVRNDNSTTDLVFQTSDATWQAYNVYGGHSLYVGAIPGFNHATKVSYNRPFYTRSGGGGSGLSEDWLFHAEFPMIRWLERNGYDVTYVTNIDAARNPGIMNNRKVFMSVGHDEYWSKEQRDNITAARNAGKHLAFFSGNEVYWKTRWENSIDGSNTPYRTLVCYKEGTLGNNTCGFKCDPSPEWTGLWRDGCSEPASANACAPENALTGQMSWVGSNAAMEVPAAYKDLRFWRHTSVTGLLPGQKAILSSNTLGYEWNYEQENGAYPNGRILLSNTIIGGKTHKLSLYKHSSGAWVFGAGTVQWSWGLDGVHDGGGSDEDPRMQQATVNLFADMNVQPATIQSGLTLTTASSDIIAPVSVINSPVNAITVYKDLPVTIKGTATDANAVGGVEISVDGGTTWKAASGTGNWSFSWTPSTTGTFTIKSRSFDDSGNMETAGTAPSSNAITITVYVLPSPTEGAGGPILVISSSANPFSRYAVEILRAEGLNEFSAMDIASVNPSVLNNYDVVVLGEMTLTVSDVNMLTTWTNAGGTLIAMRPDAQLSTLLGLTPVGSTLSDKYLLVNTASGPGAGIVNETIQFHGAADKYTLNGATSIATLYSDATTTTVWPAVTTRSVGTGKAVAFTYDLAKSIIYTRQGNPAWSGDERDGVDPIRSDDLFYGAKTGDVQPDWIDFSKIAIPQADEQQHLLANIIISHNLSRKPLPRFWFLPKGLKAAIVMTGDDHASGGTKERFEHYRSLGPNTPEAIADWTAIRGTSYIFPNTPIANSEAMIFEAEGFEIGLHLNTGCNNYTAVSLANDLDTQLPLLAAALPGIPKPVTNRTHCIAWSDWATQPLQESLRNIRLDANYYYWPGTWVLNRPGMFTGSGMPMRFANLDGSLIDCYQLTTQMTDESGISYAEFCDQLLDKALGPEGYYGVFCANMHTDAGTSAGSDAIINSALARQVPVVSARQMLQWLDARNNSTFSAFNWSSDQLTFSIQVANGANNLKAMLPKYVGPKQLIALKKNGNDIPFTFETIKGIAYAFFDAASADYLAIYLECVAPTGTITADAEVCPGEPFSLSLSAATGVEPFSLVVNGNTYNNVYIGDEFLSIDPTEVSIWGTSGTPASPAVRDNSSPIETGVKFRAEVNGFITGIRFYKGAGNVGTHTGRLWNTSGSELASAVFTGETASGWQEVRFPSPVAVIAGQTYIASYLSSEGWFAYTAGGLTTEVNNPPLKALASGVEGPNGVYLYGGGFPTNGIAANYWVDVLFTSVQPGQTFTYTLTSITDDNNCTATGTNLSSTTVTILDIPAGSLSNGGTCADREILPVFTAVEDNGPYTLVVNGNTYTNVQSGVPFNSGIIATSNTQHSVWAPSTTGGTQTVDNTQVQLGMKFKSSIPGAVKAIRFYKTDNVVRNYTVYLWDPANPGTPVRTENYTSDNTAGWKEVVFATPASLPANTTYVASYMSPSGAYYAFTGGGLASPIVNTPLTALASIYEYSGGYPDESSTANYWVDVVLQTQGSNTLNLTSIIDANGCESVGALSSITFLSAMCSPLPVDMILLSATPKNKDITLKWTTTSETNNRGFGIQRSTDGINWTTIGFVTGAGNSSSNINYIYIDANLAPKRYHYRLEQTDFDNHVKLSTIVSATITGKQQFSLAQNIPNPFQTTTTIEFTIPAKSDVELSLYDVHGRLVRVILKESRDQGGHSVTFSAEGLSRGMYFYKLTAGDKTETRKMIIQ